MYFFHGKWCWNIACALYLEGSIHQPYSYTKYSGKIVKWRCTLYSGKYSNCITFHFIKLFLKSYENPTQKQKQSCQENGKVPFVARLKLVKNPFLLKSGPRSVVDLKSWNSPLCARVRQVLKPPNLVNCHKATLNTKIPPLGTKLPSRLHFCMIYLNFMLICKSGRTTAAK